MNIQDELKNQVDNKNSILNNLLNGKPVATADVAFENKTILKMAGGILVTGVTLMVIYKYLIARK